MATPECRCGNPALYMIELRQVKLDTSRGWRTRHVWKAILAIPDRAKYCLSCAREEAARRNR
jgi:hypothetical protein